MDWTDTGLILSTRPHSENNVIVELLTRNHGRYMGLVRGGASRRQRPALQMGNAVSAEWRARLADHLGSVKIELIEPYAAKAMEDRIALAGIGNLCGLTRLLPERDPHTGIYDAFIFILDHLDNESVWPGLMVRWELELLNDLGFGLDLSECAGTGVREGLKYVSPKSGRAVSLAAGEPYKNKLLRLPKFLLPKQESETELGPSDILDGFALTGFFLDRHVLGPRGLEMPESRMRMLHYLSARQQTQN